MDFSQLPMEIRAIDPTERTVTGIVAPYNETSYLTPDPAGERIMRKAFERSISQRSTRIPLCLNHDHTRPVGMSTSWQEADEALTGVFRIRDGAKGDDVLDDLHAGYFNGLSVGFIPLDRRRANDGVSEVREAKLMEVSLVLFGAYEGAQVVAVRQASQLSELLAPFRNPPVVNLAPFVPPWQ